MLSRRPYSGRINQLSNVKGLKESRIGNTVLHEAVFHEGLRMMSLVLNYGILLGLELRISEITKGSREKLSLENI